MLRKKNTPRENEAVRIENLTLCYGIVDAPILVETNYCFRCFFLRLTSGISLLCSAVSIGTMKAAHPREIRHVFT